ncbi:MAG: hypothetical protein JRI91_13560 [Deltaproteobacteria bacterium]|nr:hypothetical protein [Deltaproteobacteria bacterium]
MIGKLWKNRIEFYPYIAIFFFWLVTALLSLLVKNRPGIVALGLVTVPSVVLITIATIKVFVEILSDET